MNNIISRDVLNFFSGKARDKASAALDLLDESIAQGFWAKGARTVKAALNKSAVAKKHALNLPDNDSLFCADMCLTYDPFKYMASAQKSLETFVGPDNTSVTFARLFVSMFAPIVAAVEQLDATRPIPVFTTMNASPTVSATLKDLDAVSVTVCPMKFERLERTDPKTGKVSYESVAFLDWPEGTKHGTSRFTSGCQCQACGHGIRNPFNWVPMVLVATDGTPKSLWVGRDCARTLFGVDMTGDLEIAEGQNPQLNGPPERQTET